MSTQRINRMLNLVVIVALTLAWLPVTLATATSVPHAQAAQMLPVETMLNPDGTLNTRRGTSGALDLRGWNVTLDSMRGPILTRDAPAPAAPNADTWSALANNGLSSGSAMYGQVRALAVSGSDLYVGGSFYQTNDGTLKNLGNIARYSGGAWSALAHNGLNGQVWAFAVSASDLYVGGAFQQTGDGTVTNLNNIARYSGGAWSALAHSGLSNNVYTLAVSGSDLYVGGSFGQTADGTVTNLNNIAKYSGGAWSALAHNGLNYGVYALAVNGSDLYVGGIFSQSADGTVTNLNYIAKYSGGAWSALANNGLSNEVRALAVSGSDLYVGGGFIETDDGAVTNLHYIARYNGGAWSALAHNGLNDLLPYSYAVYALAVSGSDLYVGGVFTQTADGTVTNLNYIAKYSGGAWSALANNGLNNTVLALAVSGSDLYVGGIFSQSADGMVTNLNRIAKLGVSAAPGPQLALTKTVSPASAKPGEAITYTIAFSNTETVIATNVMITDTLSANLTIASNTSSGVALTQVPGSRYAWTAPDLLQNQGGVITLTGILTKPLAAGTLPNTVTLAVSGTVKTANADLTVLNVAPVANAGLDQSKGISQTVTLNGSGSDDNGDGLTYGWAQTGGVTVTFTPNLSVTTFTAPATSAVLTFTLTVTDTGGLTGTDTVVVTVASLADLSVTENVVRVSNAITYTMVAQNLGPNAASDAVVSSTFPAEVTNVTWTCTGSGGAVCGGSGSGNNLADTLTTFPADGVVTYTVRGTLGLLAAGNNMVTIAPPSGVVDPNLANNQAVYRIYRCFLPLMLKNVSPQ